MKGRSHHRLQNSDPPDDWVNGSWTVDCVCGVNFDDGEEMVNCDECSVWVHTRCSKYVKGDEIFVCDKCKINNNRKESEETEVAQLLVELPTKTMRMESPYVPNGPTHGPFRIWTDVPKEEKVHVQGIPGGDPDLFGGLSSVFTPQLWKCTGYVPKKFNFQYKEFPCWDEKEGDEENENPVDKGAGVLFSLSKENVLAAPIAALVGPRDEDANGASLKVRNKWESEDMDARPVQNGLKERSLLRPMVLHSSKQKKEDLETSKDRRSKKKSKSTEKEVDMKKRPAHSSRTVFTSTSDGKQLEFYGDRGPKFSKVETQSMKGKCLRDTAGRQSSSDGRGEHDDAEKHSSEALSTDVSRREFLSGEAPEEDKLDHLPSAALQTYPKTEGVMRPLVENDDVRNVHVKKEVDSMIVDNFDDNIKASDRRYMEPHVEDMACTIPEIKDRQVHHSSFEMPVRSEKPDFEVKIEVNDAGKDPGLSSTPMSAIGTKSHLRDDVRSVDAANGSNTDRYDNLLSNSSEHKPETEGLKVSMATQKCSSQPKHDSGFPEEHSKPDGTISNQTKMEECAGKSISPSTSTLIPVSCTMDCLTSSDVLNSNKCAKQQILPDCNVITNKDRTSYDVGDGERDDNPRRNARDLSKCATNSTTKSSHPSRISQDYVSKQTMLETKDSVPCIASKSSSATASVVSVSCEPTGSHHHQKAIHTHSKRSTTGVSQKGEKHNQSNLQPSSKVNQNHAVSPCPPVPSSTKLSDEELALLLHQELNSSPRVPRVPRMRNAGSLPQLASSSAASMLLKRTSNSGGKDHSLVFRRKGKDASKDSIHSSRENADDAKRMDRLPYSHDPRKQDVPLAVDASTRREVDGSSTAVESVNIAIPTNSSATANSGPSSSTDANELNLSSVRGSPRNTSDDDTGTVGGPVHRTLPGLINEIMSKGRRMTYEELCDAVLPHWHNLRKHNGERYAYTSHSQAVLDCLRNRHEWARLVDRGPKTNSSRKRRKLDADESEDNDYGKGKFSNQVESKSLESRREEFPKGKRKARKRRRLALQGRVKDIRRRRKVEVVSDDDIGTSDNSSEESMSSDGKVQGGGAVSGGSEASDSSDEMVTL